MNERIIDLAIVFFGCLLIALCALADVLHIELKGRLQETAIIILGLSLISLAVKYGPVYSRPELSRMYVKYLEEKGKQKAKKEESQ